MHKAHASPATPSTTGLSPAALRVWLCFSFSSRTASALAAIQSLPALPCSGCHGLPDSITAFVVTGYICCLAPLAWWWWLSGQPRRAAGPHHCRRHVAGRPPSAADCAGRSAGAAGAGHGPGWQARAAGLARQRHQTRSSPGAPLAGFTAWCIRGLDLGFAVAAPVWRHDGPQPPQGVFAGARFGIGAGHCVGRPW